MRQASVGWGMVLRALCRLAAARVRVAMTCTKVLEHPLAGLPGRGLPAQLFDMPSGLEAREPFAAAPATNQGQRCEGAEHESFNVFGAGPSACTGKLALGVPRLSQTSQNHALPGPTSVSPPSGKSWGKVEQSVNHKSG